MSVVENGKYYIGVVEDNIDPKRLNRCKIRVFNIFDNLPLEALPWARPHKDNSGAESNLPNKGKIVSIEFEDGDIYMPVYRYSLHYNPSLTEKLLDMNDEDYISFKAIIFDFMTQVYRNESEGLVLDHMFNKINITKEDIILALKDNFGSINIGSETASQQAILGNHFLDWFSEFVSVLLGENGGAYLGNLQAPVVASPSLISVLNKFKKNKVPKFLSNHINLVDNDKVDKLDRISIDQIGDNYIDTENGNTTVSTSGLTNFKPKDGSKNNNPVNTDADADNKETIIEQNQEVLDIIKALEKKKYIIYTERNKLNIVGVRYVNQGDLYNNKFNDRLYVFYKDDNDLWVLKDYKISTICGNRIFVTQEIFNRFVKTVNKNIINTFISMKQYFNYIGDEGVPILAPAQYIDTYKLDKSPSIGQYIEDALIVKSEVIVYIDKSITNNIISYDIEKTGFYNINIERGYPSGTVIDSWGMGSNVFAKESALKQFIKLCNNHSDLYGNSFTYTLIKSTDIEAV